MKRWAWRWVAHCCTGWAALVMVVGAQSARVGLRCAAGIAERGSGWGRPMLQCAVHVQTPHRSAAGNYASLAGQPTSSMHSLCGAAPARQD